MKTIKTNEKGHVLVLSEKELSDIKSGLYFAMKVLDKSKGEADKQLSDRLEVLYENM